MKKIILCVFSAFVLVSIHAQKIKSYDFNVNIDVTSKQIHVKGTMIVDFKTKDSISLVLWKYSSIHSIRSNQSPLHYNFDTIAPSSMYYIQKGGNLTLVKSVKSKPQQKVFIEYSCDMSRLNGWVQSFSDNWIELNYYSAWFPVKGGNFTSNFNITIGESYNITGSGVVSQKNGGWNMKQNWGGFDNVIIASKKLKSKLLIEKDARIELGYSELTESAADSALAESKFTYNLFDSIFGNLGKTNLKLVLNTYEDGGGYSRKNFISWWSKKYDFNTRCGLSHEIGHLWWSGANATTWEDWLNESFAEYCKLLFIRERISPRVYNLNVKSFREWSQNTPAIWGLNRDDPKAYTVLYQKGALILTEFEQKVGTEQFFEFLRLVRKEKVRTTADFLSLTEQHFSKELRDWLENKLKTF